MEIPRGLKKYITECLLPFRTLPDETVTSLLGKIELETCSRDTVLFEHGDTRGDVFYLLTGKVQLQTAEGTTTLLEPGKDEAMYPLSNMLPRRYTVTVLQAAQFLRLNRAVFNGITSGKDGRTDMNDGADGLVEVEELDWMTSLLQSQIFTRIPSENIQQIFALFEEVSTEVGEKIIIQGDSGDYYFIIKEGIFRVLRKGKNNQEFLLAHLHEGEGFGEEALIGNIPRNASVVSDTQGKLLRISKQDFLSLIRDPAIKMLSYPEAMNCVKQGAVLMDVRFPEECNASSLPGSLNYPLDTLRIQMKNIDPLRKYIVCCDDGTRSAIAAFLLLEHGFDVNCIKTGIGDHLVRHTKKPGKFSPATVSSHQVNELHEPSRNEPAHPDPENREYDAEAMTKSLLSKRSNVEDLSRALSEVLSNVYAQLEQALREKSEAEIAKQIAESKLENLLKLSK